MSTNNSGTVLDAVRRLFHDVDDPAFVYTPDGILVYVNPAYDELFRDRYPEGTLGKNGIGLEPEKSELVAEMVATNLARKPGDPDLIIESPSRNAEGDMRWYEWRCIQEFDEQDNVTLVAVISRDLTEQRVAELQNQRMTTRLEESNRDLLEFAQVASHDLQEPLRKVSTFCNRLEHKLDGRLDERSRTYMERMNNAIFRMQRLIQDLLTFAKVNTEGTPMVDINLSAVIDPVLADLEIAIEDDRAEIIVGPMPTLPIDESQLGQLFQNLIGNALKFRQAGVAPRIEVTAEHIPAPGTDSNEPLGGWYEITVADNGIGFDQKHAIKVFAAFQRLNGKSEYPGSGVGLSVCRRIVERHQGTITASSSEGEGATFVIRLPTSHVEDYIPGEDGRHQTLDEHEGLGIEYTVIDTANAA